MIIDMKSTLCLTASKTLAFASLLAVFGAAPLSAQGAAKKTEGKMEGMEHSMMGMQEPATGWKELDAFHTILAATWHPASRKNDLAPLKAQAADLAAAAQTGRHQPHPRVAIRRKSMTPS